MNKGYWIRCDTIFFKVEGKPVHVCDGIETFAHRPLVALHKDIWEVMENVWEISDARTGLAFGVRQCNRARTIEGATQLAKEKLVQVAKCEGGLEGWIKALESQAVSPRYFDEYYDSRTAKVLHTEAKATG